MDGIGMRSHGSFSRGRLYRPAKVLENHRPGLTDYRGDSFHSLFPRQQWLFLKDRETQTFLQGALRASFEKASRINVQCNGGPQIRDQRILRRVERIPPGCFEQQAPILPCIVELTLYVPESTRSKPGFMNYLESNVGFKPFLRL